MNTKYSIWDCLTPVFGKNPVFPSVRVSKEMRRGKGPIVYQIKNFTLKIRKFCNIYFFVNSELRRFCQCKRRTNLEVNFIFRHPNFM